jgi:hypothetical protein
MKNLALIACAALPLFACAGAVDEGGNAAQQSDAVNLAGLQLLVDFDQVNGTAVPNNSVVDTTYSGSGVTFSCIVCASGHAYARALGTGTQGVSLIDPQASILPFFDARDGAVTATFNDAKNWASIDAAPVLPPEFSGTPTNLPWLEAYDANGNKLGEALYPIAYGQTGYGTPQTLTVNVGSATIKTVRFSSQHSSGPAVYGTFDNLRANGISVIFVPRPVPTVRPIIQ